MTKQAIGWNNYATHERTRYPELWHNCILAIAPCLGPTGGRVFDLSIQKAFGNLSGMDLASDWVVSNGFYALDFDGINDNFSISGLRLSRFNVVSVSIWFYWYGFANNDDLLMEYTANYNTSGQGFIINPNDSFGGGSFGINQTSQPAQDQAYFARPAAATWHHLTIVFKRSGSDTIKAYLNGNTWTPTTRTQNVPTQVFSDANLNVPCRNAANLFGNCMIADLRLYGRELSQAEARILANRPTIAYERRSRRRVNEQAASLNAIYATRQTQLIGGGLL